MIANDPILFIANCIYFYIHLLIFELYSICLINTVKQTFKTFNYKKRVSHWT